VSRIRLFQHMSRISIHKQDRRLRVFSTNYQKQRCQKRMEQHQVKNQKHPRTLLLRQPREALPNLKSLVHTVLWSVNLQRLLQPISSSGTAIISTLVGSKISTTAAISTLAGTTISTLVGSTQSTIAGWGLCLARKRRRKHFHISTNDQDLRI